MTKQTNRIKKNLKELLSIFLIIESSYKKYQKQLQEKYGAPSVKAPARENFLKIGLTICGELVAAASATTAAFAFGEIVNDQATELIAKTVHSADLITHIEGSVAAVGGPFATIAMAVCAANYAYRYTSINMGRLVQFIL